MPRNATPIVHSPVKSRGGRASTRLYVLFVARGLFHRTGSLAAHRERLVAEPVSPHRLAHQRPNGGRKPPAPNPDKGHHAPRPRVFKWGRHEHPMGGASLWDKAQPQN